MDNSQRTQRRSQRSLRLKKIAVALLILIQMFDARAQKYELSEVITSIAEELASDESDPGAIEVYSDRLSELAENPVHINSSGAGELSRLFFLSDFQINSLSDYIHSSGKIYSVYEIANIPGFNRETALMIHPFITIDETTQSERRSFVIHNSAIINYLLKPGPGDTAYTGSSGRLLGKYRFTGGGFKAGLTFEKDHGEKLFSGTPSRPDFVSSFLSWSGKGIIREVIIGDFTGRFGQGTVINSGPGQVLSLTSSGYMAAAGEIRPYTSSDENNFFRGFASEMSIREFSLRLFWSVNSVDATPDPEETGITSFYRSGIHNTPGSLSRKDVVSITSYGFDLAFNPGNIRTGILLACDRLSLPVVKSADPAGLFDFSGDRSDNCSVYYSATAGKVILFGEASLNQDRRMAIVQGSSVRLSGRLSVNCLFRSYNPGFYSLHGRASGLSSSNPGKGFTGNFTFETARNLFISAGCDRRDYSWLRYRNSSPSQELRHEIRVKWVPAGDLTAELMYSFRSSTRDDSESGFVRDQEQLITKDLRATVRYAVSGDLTLMTKLEHKKTSVGSTGMLMLQDITYKPVKIPLTIWFRYCLFSAQSWDSRLYVYENDLLYNFSIPALSGEGSRSYLMLKYDLKDFAEIRVKYGLTSSKNKQEDDLRLQLRLIF